MALASLDHSFYYSHDYHTATVAGPSAPLPGKLPDAVASPPGGNMPQARGAALRLLTAAAGPFVLIALAGIVSPAAAASVVTCGATLKSNTTLTEDLDCQDGRGLTLYRGVTLDLNGHTLEGPGSTDGTGVTLSYKGGSTVTNGTIRGWQTGVTQVSQSDDIPASFLKNVTIVDAPSTGFLDTTLKVIGSRFTNSPISAEQSTISITSSNLARSDLYADAVTVASSTLTTTQTIGRHSVSIDSSVLDGTGNVGSFSWCYLNSMSVTNSTIKNFAYSTPVFSCDVMFSHNVATDNPGGVLNVDYGLDATGGPIVIDKNLFRRSGIVLSGGGMTVTDNTFDRNTSGIVFNDPRKGGFEDRNLAATVTGNKFTNNTSSGVRSDATGISVGNNRAIGNGRYGIYAPQAHNLGGNVARGNAKGNCVGLTCSP